MFGEVGETLQLGPWGMVLTGWKLTARDPNGA